MAPGALRVRSECHAVLGVAGTAILLVVESLHCEICLILRTQGLHLKNLIVTRVTIQPHTSMALVAEQHRFYRFGKYDLPTSYRTVFCHDKALIYSNHCHGSKD